MSAALRSPQAGRDAPLTRWPALVAAVALGLYFLVAHGCHGDDVDHELLFTPVRAPVESNQVSE